ncbi:hypothetical protein N8Z24_00775 [bacterium]|nr:hypothetical protein [bacterium]
MEVKFGMIKDLLEALVDKISDDSDKEILEEKFKPLAIIDDYPGLKKLHDKCSDDLLDISHKIMAIEEESRKHKKQYWDDLIAAMHQSKLIPDNVTSENTSFKLNSGVIYVEKDAGI